MPKFITLFSVTGRPVTHQFYSQKLDFLYSVFCFMFYPLKRGGKTVKLNLFYCNTAVTHRKTVMQRKAGGLITGRDLQGEIKPLVAARSVFNREKVINYLKKLENFYLAPLQSEVTE